MATQFIGIKTHESDTEQCEYRFWQEGLQRRAERSYGNAYEARRGKSARSLPAKPAKESTWQNGTGHNDIYQQCEFYDPVRWVAGPIIKKVQLSGTTQYTPIGQTKIFSAVR